MVCAAQMAIPRGMAMGSPNHNSRLRRIRSLRVRTNCSASGLVVVVSLEKEEHRSHLAMSCWALMWPQTWHIRTSSGEASPGSEVIRAFEEVRLVPSFNVSALWSVLEVSQYCHITL